MLIFSIGSKAIQSSYVFIFFCHSIKLCKYLRAKYIEQILWERLSFKTGQNIIIELQKIMTNLKYLLSFFYFNRQQWLKLILVNTHLEFEWLGMPNFDDDREAHSWGSIIIPDEDYVGLCFRRRIFYRNFRI